MAAKSQTSTAAFKAWFGNSKVVDGRGRPLRVFHGTAGDFTQFDPEKVGTRHVDVEAGTAFFFTPRKDTANYYAQSAGDIAGGGANVMPVYLAMQNPLDVDFQGTGIELLGGEVELAKQRGHDGLIARNYDDGVLDTHYIVFSPEQVKSAIGNVGGFEIDNPDLRFSVVHRDIVPSEMSTPERVREAIAQLVRVSADELAEGLGRIVVGTSEELQAGLAEVPVQRDTALRAWFGDSQVVDGDGKPLVVYHGTDAAPFSVFRRSRFATYGDGMYFASSKEEAEGYGSRVEPVYLRVRNPLRVKEGQYADIDAADQDGHDGLIVEVENGQFFYVVSDPTQIKSAIGNRGTYDPKDPDIRHSLAGPGVWSLDKGAEFQRWFGGSKVVDGDGKPLMLFHGTGADTGSEFRPGSFFADRPDVAAIYATAPTRQVDDGAPNISPVYLALHNPYVHDDLGSGENLSHAVLGRRGSLEMVREALIGRGYDGVVIRNRMDLGGVQNQYVAFHPEQVKSATGNRGSYDPKSPDIRHSLAGLDPRAQAWHDVATNTTVFLADRIAAGKESSVFLHETVHRHGRAALPEGRWDALVGQVKAWAKAEPQSPERAIHDAAAARVATAGVAGALADEELFAYAVEEAVARGIEPSAAAVEGSAEAWLQAVVESIQRISDKLLGNDLQELGGQDLVDLAYALAQLDSPEHGVEVRKALLASAALASALAFRIESRDGPSGQSNLRLVAEAQGIQVGRIDYSVYRGEPAIEMIHVDGGLRRRGIGRAMAIRLQMEYPDTEIRWGGLTSDGAKLYESIPKTFIQDLEFLAKREELSSVERKLAMYAELGDKFHALVAPTDDQRAAFLASVSDWNDLHDAQGELERYVAFTAPGKTILCAEGGANQEREFEGPIIRD